MVIALFRGMCCPDPQYSAISNRETKYIRLGYMTRLSRLDTLDPTPPHLTLDFLSSGHSAHCTLSKKITQGPKIKLQVPQANPPVIGLHN
jgi:hypothetical protein